MWTSVHQRKKMKQKPRHGPQWCQGRQGHSHQRHSRHTPRHLLPHDVRHRHQDSTEAIRQLDLEPFLEFTDHLHRTIMLASSCWTYLSPGGTQPYITIIPVELCRGWAVGRSVFCLVTRFLAFLNRRRSCAIGSKNSAEDVAGSLVERNRWMCWLKVSHQYSIIRQILGSFGRFLLIIDFFQEFGASSGEDFGIPAADGGHQKCRSFKAQVFKKRI